MKHELTDHALAVVKAALNAVPVIGGPVASLISDYVPNAHQRSVETAADLLAEKVKAIEGRIKVDLIDKDGFSNLFAEFRVLAAKTNREEKLRAAANILANALLPPNDPSKSSYEELEHLMHCADALSSGAVAVLGASIQIRAPRHTSQGDAPFHFPELRRKLPAYDPNLVFGLATELRSLNLLHITEGIINASDFEGYLFRVTPLGLRFAERFIEGRM